MNRFMKYVTAGTLAAGAIAFLSPAMLVAQMGAGGLDTPTTTPPPPAMPEEPTTKPAEDNTATMVESPIYAAWKGKGVGTSVNYTMTVNQLGQVMNGKMTSTLKEITDSKVTLTQTVTSAMQEKPEESEESIDARVPAAQKWKVAGDGMAWTEAGTERVTVLGKEYNCTKLTTKMEQMGATMTGVAYYTAEIPGGLIKADLDATSPQGNVKITIVVDSISVK